MSLQIFWLNNTLRYWCTVLISVIFGPSNNTCSLYYLQNSIYKSDTITYITKFLENIFYQWYWTHIINFQLTPNVQWLQASIMLQSHLSISYTNPPLFRSPTRIWHYTFAILGFLRQSLIQLLHIRKIKSLWLSMFSVEGWIRISDKCMVSVPSFHPPTIC